MKFQYPLTIMVSLIILLIATTSNSQNVPAPPGSCGPEAGGLTCDEGWCCSNWGFCGNTSDYCIPGENCQSQCWGTPPPPPPASPPPPLPNLCGIDWGNNPCPDEDNMCCTVEGRCAYKGSSWCDAGDCQYNCNSPPNCGIQAGYKDCPQNQCCSIAGLCADYSSTACHLHCLSQCPPSTFNKEMIITMLKNTA